MIWLQFFLEGLGHKQEKSLLYCDSKRVIWYHFIRLALADGVLVLEKIQGSKNPEQMLTKTDIIDKLRLRSASVGLQV